MAETDPDVVQSLTRPDHAHPVVRRTHSHGAERDPLGGTEVAPDIDAALSRRRGGGSALPTAVAGRLGAAMGADFSSVRVHHDAEADSISRSLQAKAFTHGRDVYFTAGTYAPGTSSGQRLLAHELTHVVQNQTGVQRSASGSATTVGRADDSAETEADKVADHVVATLRRQAAHSDRAPANDGDSDQAPSTGDVVGALRRQASRVDLASGGVVRRGIFDSIFGSGKKKYPRTVKLSTDGKEKVVLEKAEDETEAEGIFKDLKDNYGIDVSSATTITAIKSQYTRVKKKELSKLKASEWQMKELRALHAAAGHFAPILGTQRAESTLADKAQGVTTVGRLEEAVDRNTDKGKVDRGTMGEYFAGSSNVGFFDTVTNLSDNRYLAPGKTTGDNATTLEANAIHEMAHGLIQPTELANWIAKMSFWTDRYTPSGKKGAEEPPTAYGKRGGAAEDLAESVAIFFTNPARLKSIAPKREAFLAKMVAGWTPKKKADVIDGAKESTGGNEPTQPTEPTESGATKEPSEVGS